MESRLPRREYVSTNYGVQEIKQVGRFQMLSLALQWMLFHIGIN